MEQVSNFRSVPRRATVCEIDLVITRGTSSSEDPHPNGFWWHLLRRVGAQNSLSKETLEVTCELESIEPTRVVASVASEYRDFLGRLQGMRPMLALASSEILGREVEFVFKPEQKLDQGDRDA